MFTLPPWCGNIIATTPQEDLAKEHSDGAS